MTGYRDPSRALRVFADGQETASGCRLQLRGRETLSLYPDMFTLTIYDLSDSSRRLLMRSSFIEVRHLDAVIASGEIADVALRTTDDGTQTTVTFGRGLSFWNSSVSLSVEGGRKASEILPMILSAAALPGYSVSSAAPSGSTAAASSGSSSAFYISASSNPILLSFRGKDVLYPRGQSFFCRAADAVSRVLRDCGSEAYLTDAGIAMVPSVSSSAPVTSAESLDTASASVKTVTIGPDDLTDTPHEATGAVILSVILSGWSVGLAASVSVPGFVLSGLIRERLIDADTASGPWKCELLVERSFI